MKAKNLDRLWREIAAYLAFFDIVKEVSNDHGMDSCPVAGSQR